MTTSFARFLSIALHPLLMPTLLFGILLYQTPAILGLDVFSGTMRFSLLVLIFIGTFAVPSLLVYYLVRSGFVSNMRLETLADRRLPFFLTAVVYTVLTFLFAFRMQLVSTIAPDMAILLGSITLSILLVGLISLYWQISAHGVGIGGVVGVIGSLMLRFSETNLFFPLLLLVLLTGLMASARLKLNAHTPAQIGAGLALGMSVSLATVFWLF